MPDTVPPTAVRPITVAPAGIALARAVIEIDDVDFCYGASKALHDITLNIHQREVTAFIGPSGCGKSTLLRCLNRMNDLIDGARVSAGQIRIDGVNIYDPRVDVIELRKRVGMVFQKSNPFPKSVYDNITYGLRIQGQKTKSRLDEVVERSLRGAALWDEVKDRLHESALGMSGGQQQRLMIVRALMHEPDIIFLDEPTVGLDPQARLGLWDILRDLHARGRTIVMTTHYMDEADRLCDRLAIIDRGKLLALDSPRALKAKAPGGTLLELVLDGDAMPAAELAETLAGISRVEAQDGILRAHSDRGGQLLPALIEVAESTGRTVTDIHLLQPSLETLFVSLTGRKLG